METVAVRAVLDANVLYPAAVRDLFVYLARAEIFQPHWSERIHAEWTRNLLSNRPDLDPRRLQRTINLMERAVPGALVTGHERRISGLQLPDPDDRHVLAAAVECGAAKIVTFNVRDFPAHSTEPLGVGVVHPDEFAAELLAGHPVRFCAAVAEQRKGLSRPPSSVPRYLDNLRTAGLGRTAMELERVEAASPGTL